MVWTLWWLAVAALAVFAFRRAVLAVASLRPRPAPAAPPDWYPPFWVVSTIRNNEARVAGLCVALGLLDYPSIRVVLVDDASDDSTLDRLREHADPGWHVVASPDSVQTGKAAALRAAIAGLAMPADDLILVVDADHELPADTLHRLVGWFADPRTQAVAFAHRARAGTRSLPSVYCDLESAVSEDVTNRGRATLGLGVSLAGTWACRVGAFQRYYPDGWQLVDDAVFAARLHAAGWRVEYATDMTSVHDVPDTVGTYLRQHIRWSAGLYRVGRTEINKLMQSPRSGSISRLDQILASAGYAERPIALLWLATTLALWLIGSGHLGLLLPPSVITLIVLLQSAVALVHIRASVRMWLLTPPALVTMVAVDVLASIAGACGTVVRRVGWQSPERDAIGVP